MTRITTNMIMRNYMGHLSNTVGGLESTRKQVETGRRFEWSYEDPSAAAKGAVLDRRYARNADYLDVTQESQKWLDTQESVLMELNSIAQDIDENYSTAAMNDPAGEVGRSAYATELRALQESMINSLNVKYGDAFVMAGNDAMNVPFELKDGEVYYRGVNVDAQKPVTAQYSLEITTDGGYLEGDEITINGTVYTIGTADEVADDTAALTAEDANDAEKLAEFIAGKVAETETDYDVTTDGNKIIYTATSAGAIGSDGPASEPAAVTVSGGSGAAGVGALETVTEGMDADESYALLEQYSQEAAYVDLGFGLTFDADGKVVPSSAFDTALPGINAVGFGKDDDGLSNNLIVLTGQMADLLEADEFDSEAYGVLWTKFHEQYQDLANEFATIGAKSQLLESTETRLTTEKDNIYEQYKDTVGIEEDEAITNYMWAQYAYNVALKIGTSIIGPSLLDFMD